MTGRRRTPGDGDDGGPSPRPRAAGTVAEAQESIADVARAGRAGTSARDRGGTTPHPDDVELRRVMGVYDGLGTEPPTFNVARNDDAYESGGAHTIARHGPDIPLPRDPTQKTIEGRIYGDPDWDRPENRSYRWADHSTMNRTINNYVRRNWDEIRSDLALYGRHRGGFDAGRRIGEGYVNPGMHGAGPRGSQYTATSLVKVRIGLVPGSDPPEPFVISAFPAGIM